MLDPIDTANEGFTTTPWDADGIATLEATGPDARTTLEIALRGVLTLAGAPVRMPDDTTRSAPIQGEGDDLAILFTELARDLLDQIDDFGSGLQDVVVDGVLRQEGGAYIAWGYASGSLNPDVSIEPPRLLESPQVIEDDTRVRVRAKLRRS